MAAPPHESYGGNNRECHRSEAGGKARGARLPHDDGYRANGQREHRNTQQQTKSASEDVQDTKQIDVALHWKEPYCIATRISTNVAGADGGTMLKLIRAPS